MEQPTYVTIDENGYMTGRRPAQRDPRGSDAAGEDVWFGPGKHEADMAPPADPGEKKILRWLNGAWVTEDDFRGEVWFSDWEVEVEVTEPGPPVGLVRTQAELPLEKLQAIGDDRLFNWGWFQKHGDQNPILHNGVQLWSDEVSREALMLEWQVAQITPNYSLPSGWKGKNGTVPVPDLAALQAIVLAYHTRQAEVHADVVARRAALAAETDRDAAYATVRALFDDIEASGDW